MRRRSRAIVSFNMSRIRGRDTKPELTLRRTLHAMGLRFRVHGKLPGRPDIVFSRAKLTVFVDGAFWHGRDLSILGSQLHVRKKFWLAKINANVERDRRNDAELRKLGYRVMRFWDDEVLASPERCAQKIQIARWRRLMRDGITSSQKRARLS